MIPNFVHYLEASRLRFPEIDPKGDFYRDTNIMADKLRSLGLNIRSFREPLDQSVRKVIIPSIHKNFQQEGRPPWARLTVPTIMERGSAHPILQRTRLLYTKATQLNIWKIDKTSAGVSYLDSKVRYAGFHQGGTSKMPARPFMQITSDDQDAIIEVFYGWFVNREMRKLGLAP